MSKTHAADERIGYCVVGHRAAGWHWFCFRCGIGAICEGEPQARKSARDHRCEEL